MQNIDTCRVCVQGLVEQRERRDAKNSLFPKKHGAQGLRSACFKDMGVFRSS